jgi:uncharacterized protein YyaL (SSP411 family)
VVTREYRQEPRTLKDVPPIDWLHDWDDAFERARAENKVVLIDVEKDN